MFKKIIVSVLIFILAAVLGVVAYFFTRTPKVTPADISSQALFKTIRSYEVVGEINFPFQKPLAIGIESEHSIDNSYNVYVSEFYAKEGDNARILKFDARGRYLDWFGKGDLTTGWHESNSNSAERSLPGSGDGEFIGVSKIIFADDGRTYILDGASVSAGIGNYRIQVFDRNWNFLGWIGKGERTTGWHGPNSGETGQKTIEPGGFYEPDGMAVQDGEILVGGWGTYRVDRFKTDGTYLGWLGKAENGTFGWHAPEEIAVAGEVFGSEEGAFNAPVGIQVYDGKIYVTDFYNDPVLSVFDYDSGEFLWGRYHSQINKPVGIILDQYGNIITEDFYEGSIKFFDPSGNLKAAHDLGPSEYYGAAGFAFDDRGYNLYFTEHTANKVIKLQLMY